MGRRKVDNLDLEAEREGEALKKSFKSNRPVGKRIMKIRRGHDRGNRIIQTRIEGRHV